MDERLFLYIYLINNLKIYDTGSPFPVSAKGAMFLVGIPFPIILYNYKLIGTEYLPLGLTITSGIFFLLTLIVYVARSSFIIDHDNKRYKSIFSVFGIRLGNWKSFDNIEAIAIKYVQLSDRKNMRFVGYFTPVMIRSGRFYDNQHNLDQEWRVIFKSKGKEPHNIFGGSKEKALELLNTILNVKEVPVYSGVFMKSREVHTDRIRKGEIIFKQDPRAQKRR